MFDVTRETRIDKLNKKYKMSVSRETLISIYNDL